MRLLGAEKGHWGAVSEYRANARFLERVDGGIGMGRRIDYVAPIEQRCNAGIDLIERSDQIADVHVLRRIEADDLANQHAKIVVERPVRGNAPERGLPEVDVAVYKARHGDHAAAVDLDNGPTADIAADRDDLAVVDEEVAGLDDPERGIHRHNFCALHSYSWQHRRDSVPMDEIHRELIR
jgi:hypothetical protein